MDACQQLATSVLLDQNSSGKSHNVAMAPSSPKVSQLAELLLAAAAPVPETVASEAVQSAPEAVPSTPQNRVSPGIAPAPTIDESPNYGILVTRKPKEGAIPKQNLTEEELPRQIKKEESIPSPNPMESARPSLRRSLVEIGLAETLMGLRQQDSGDDKTVETNNEESLQHLSSSTEEPCNAPKERLIDINNGPPYFKEKERQKVLSSSDAKSNTSIPTLEKENQGDSSIIEQMIKVNDTSQVNDTAKIYRRDFHLNNLAEVYRKHNGESPVFTEKERKQDLNTSKTQSSRPSPAVEKKEDSSSVKKKSKVNPTYHLNNLAKVYRKKTTETERRIEMPVLHPYDVMCSRSKVAFKAIGNRRLRIMFELHAPRYERTHKKTAKGNLVSSIVETVQSAGGRFIRKNKTTGEWEEAPHEIAKEKVGHGLRDAVANKGRSIYEILGLLLDFSTRMVLKDESDLRIVEVAQKAEAFCNAADEDTKKKAPSRIAKQKAKEIRRLPQVPAFAAAAVQPRIIPHLRQHTLQVPVVPAAAVQPRIIPHLQKHTLQVPVFAASAVQPRIIPHLQQHNALQVPVVVAAAAVQPRIVPQVVPSARVSAGPLKKRRLSASPDTIETARLANGNSVVLRNNATPWELASTDKQQFQQQPLFAHQATTTTRMDNKNETNHHPVRRNSAPLKKRRLLEMPAAVSMPSFGAPTITHVVGGLGIKPALLPALIHAAPQHDPHNNGGSVSIFCSGGHNGQLR